jgi:hypothetical protein
MTGMPLRNNNPRLIDIPDRPQRGDFSFGFR